MKVSVCINQSNQVNKEQAIGKMEHLQSGGSMLPTEFHTTTSSPG
jgi:hypothetical protein